MGYIYKITNLINKKSYVGKTSLPLQYRLAEHKRNFFCVRDEMVIHKAMFKYGVENFDFEELEQCDETILNEREQYWIRYYDTYENGYNSTLGGEGSPKYDYQVFYSMWEDGKSIKEISELTNAERHTITKALKMLDISEEEIKSRSLGRRVEQYSLDGNFIKTHDSVSLAAREIGNALPGNIQSCCQGIHPSAYNYLWKFEDENISVSHLVERYKKTGKGMKKEVEQYSLDGEYIQTHSSCREAARSINAPYHVGISACCIGKQKSAYGYKWKYKE